MPGGRLGPNAFSNKNAPWLQNAARGDIYAAPFDALMLNGSQINGSMDVSQENGTTQITIATAVDKYIVDGWYCGYIHAAATAVFKGQQVAPPGSPMFGGAFQNCLQLTATTLSAMAGAGDFAYIRQPMEGYRVARLGFGNAVNPQSVTIGFWVYATIPGVATVSLRNSATNRAYLANFQVSKATTWEYKTVTIPVDTSGTWLVTNGIGAQLTFCFGSGSTFQGTNRAWQATNVFATAQTTNFFASNSNTVCLTGVVVLPGAEAPSALRSSSIMRSFDVEMLLCQRYWEKSYEYATALGTATSVGTTILFLTTGTWTNPTAAGISTPYKVKKRAVPTVTTYSSGTGTAGQVRESYNGADKAASATASQFGHNTTTSGMTAGNGFQLEFQWAADARL